MRKYLITILLVLVTCNVSIARNRRNDFFTNVHYGLEWGYQQHFYTYHNYNYINQEGNRIPGGRQGFDWSPAGSVLVEIGYDFSTHWGIEFMAGYSGLSTEDRYLPILMRFDYFHQGYLNRGTFTFLQGGAGMRMPLGSAEHMAILGAIGQGYRLPLAKGINLDMMVSLQAGFDAPPINNPDGPGKIPERNIRKNNARYYALNISVGINF